MDTTGLDCFGLTRHFEERARERGLDPHVAAFIAECGRLIKAGPVFYLVVVPRRLPRDVRTNRTARAASRWTFVVSLGGALITCYRTKPRRKCPKISRREREIARDPRRLVA